MDVSYPGKILLIDDDQDTRDAYTEILKQANFKVDTAVDGEEGLVKIIQGGYDLILLDIMMPKLDGLAVLKRLKQEPPTAYNGPIVILSALDQDQIIKSAMEFGAKGFITKGSTDPQQVIDRVYEFLKDSPALA